MRKGMESILGKGAKGERLILSKNVSLKIGNNRRDIQDLNLLVIGNDSDRVRRSFIEPNILDMPKRTSFVIAGKGNRIWQDTHEAMERAGYDVIYFNPYDLEHTYRFAPLNWDHDDDEAVWLADTLFNEILSGYMESDDQSWQDAERNLLRAAIIYMNYNCGETKTRRLEHVVGYIEKFVKGRECFDEYYRICRNSSYPDSGDAYKRAYEELVAMPVNKLNAIVSVLTSRMALFVLKDFRELTQDDHCRIYKRFYQEFHEGTAVYICYGTEDRSYDFLSRILFAQCVQEIIKRSRHDGEWNHVRFIMDGVFENGDIRMEMPEFFDIIPKAGKWNASFQLIMPDMELFRHKIYPDWKHKAYNIQSILYLGSPEILTQDYVFDQAERSWDYPGNEEAVSKRAIIRSEIKSLPPDGAVSIIGKNDPVFDIQYGSPDKQLSDNGNMVCTNNSCKEPTKKITGITCPFASLDPESPSGIYKQQYTYTCARLEAEGSCPKSAGVEQTIGGMLKSVIKKIVKKEAVFMEKSTENNRQGKNSGTLPDKDAMILSKNKWLPINGREKNCNALAVGGSGSGKSRYVIKPNLLQANCSFVVNDPAGDLLRSHGKYLESVGYKIKVFNLDKMDKSDRYNPFEYIRDDICAKTLAACIIKNTMPAGASKGDPFWEKTEEVLLSALISYVRLYYPREKQNFTSVMELLQAAEVDENSPEVKSKLDRLFEDLEKNDPESSALKSYKLFKMGGAKTLKGILISVAVRLDIFNYKNVKDLTCRDTVDLAKIGDEKTALFITVSETNNMFNFLATMIYSQLFETLYYHAEYECCGRLNCPVRFLLDEFANIGEIPNFNEKLATIRKYGMSCTIVLQSIAQIKKMYEKDYQSLIDNCDSTIFLGSSEGETAKWISDKLGKGTIKYTGNSFSKSGNSRSVNRDGRTLMEANEMSYGKFENGECIVFVRGEYPFVDDLFDYTKHPAYNKTGDADSANIYERSLTKSATKEPAKIVKPSRWNREWIKYSEKMQGKGAMVLSKKLRLSLDTVKTLRNCKVMCIGGSETEATRQILEPNILQANASFVITDHSGDLLKRCKEPLEKKGYTVKVLDLRDPGKSPNRYNPFRYLKTSRDVQLFVLSILNDNVSSIYPFSNKYPSEEEKFQENPDRCLLFAVTEYLRLFGDKKKQNLGQIAKMLKMGANKADGTGDLTELDAVFDNIKDNGSPKYTKLLQAYDRFRDAELKKHQDVLPALIQKLDWCARKDVIKMTKTDTVHLETIGNRKTALFIEYSTDTDGSYGSCPLFPALFSQLMSGLYNTAERIIRGALPVPVLCLLDNVGNTGEIPEFTAWLATMRSYGIGCIMYVHDLSVLAKLYPKLYDEWLCSHCDTVIYLGGDEPLTIQFIEKRLHGTIPDEAKVDKTHCIVAIRGDSPFLDERFNAGDQPD